jgi:hypothetical protein
MYKLISKLPTIACQNIQTKFSIPMKIEKRIFQVAVKKASISFSNKKNPIMRASSKLFYRINNKSIINFFKKKKFNPFGESNEYTEQILKNKKEDYFDVHEHLIFQEGKLQITSANDSDKNLANRLKNFLVVPATAFFGYKLGNSIIFFRPIRSVIWGLLFFASVRLYKGLSINKHYFIYNINLLQDGKRVELLGESEPLIVDIKEIRRLTPEETLYVNEMFPDARMAYLPLVVKDQFFLMFNNSKIYHKEIFKAISQGKYIRVKEDNIINRDDSIDI